MSFQELLTKLSIVCLGISAVKSNVMSAKTAIIFTVALVVVSFIRDENLRSRRVIRMQPSYGVWFVISYLTLLPFMILIKWITCSDFLKPWETVYAAATISMGFRIFLIFCEGATRLICSKLFGFDNQRLDAVQQQLNRAWKAERNSCRSGSCGVTVSAVPRCPQCGTESIPGVGYCVMCYQGSSSGQVQNIGYDSPCSLPLIPRRI